MADVGSTNIAISGSATALLISSDDMMLHIEGKASDADGPLMHACRAARAKGEAMAALTASVADLSPTDPRHDAAYAAVGQLRPAWEREIAMACRQSAKTRAGLTAKAELVAVLFDRETDGVVTGGPALRVAASLVDDILAGASRQT